MLEGARHALLQHGLTFDVHLSAEKLQRPGWRRKLLAKVSGSDEHILLGASAWGARKDRQSTAGTFFG